MSGGWGRPPQSERACFWNLLLKWLLTKPERQGEGPPASPLNCIVPNGLCSQLMREMFNRNLTEKATDSVMSE